MIQIECSLHIGLSDLFIIVGFLPKFVRCFFVKLVISVLNYHLFHKIMLKTEKNLVSFDSKCKFDDKKSLNLLDL